MIALIVAALLPLAAHWSRGKTEDGCDLDGLPISASHRVRVTLRGGSCFEFCSIVCAELWLESSDRIPERIVVTDEITGGELDATSATFVQSSVITHAPTGDQRHSFARRADAELHAKLFRGQILSEADEPFAPWLPSPN